MYLNLSFNPNQTGGEAGSSPLLSSLQEATSTSTYVYLHHLALQSFLQPTQSHSGGETPKAHAPLPGAAKYRNISILIYIYMGLLACLLACLHTYREVLCTYLTTPSVQTNTYCTWYAHYREMYVVRWERWWRFASATGRWVYSFREDLARAGC
jgi:hypothetical protein